MKFKLLVLAAAAAMSSACTWVEPTDAGRQVVIGQDFNVGHCQKLGRTTVSVKAAVGAFDRDAEKVEKELNMLGQNEAAAKGGDTIVPAGPVTDGGRSYDIYRCRS